MNNELNAFERDMLLETASIAAGKTLQSIQNIIGQPTTLEPPQLTLTGMEHIADSMGGPHEVKSIVYTHIIGGARGAIVFMIDPNEADKLLSHVDKTLRMSALEELTNVVAGTALGSLTKLLDIVFLQSVPVSTTDMLRAVVNEVVADLGGNTAEVLSLLVSLRIGASNTPASLYLLFDPDTTAAIISAGKRITNK